MAPPNGINIENDVLQELKRRAAELKSKENASRGSLHGIQIPLFTTEQLPRVEKHLQGVEILNARSTKTTGPRMGLDAVTDIYGPEFQESLSNAKARRIEIQSHLPDVGIERTKDKVVGIVESIIDSVQTKAGDAGIKTGLVEGAVALGVVKKVPFFTAQAALAPATLTLQADPANTLEAAAESRLADIEQQKQKDLDARILMLQIQGLVNDKFQVLPVWEQDP